MAEQIYDRIGRGYARVRQTEPRILQPILRALGQSQSILNVGAGSGSYEPAARQLVAVEPSAEMIRQRRSLYPVVQAQAEALPFSDHVFDACLAVLTVHHWQDIEQGLAECRRVARHKICILTWDPESSAESFWLTQQYFPAMLEADRKMFPRLSTIEAALGPLQVQAVPIPADCIDGMLGAYWQRPQAYLDPQVRAGISSLAAVADDDRALQQLRSDLQTGQWRRRNADLLQASALDIGYRLLQASY